MTPQIDGHQVKAGERVILYWASANRDEAESTAPWAMGLIEAAIWEGRGPASHDAE